MSGVDVHSVYKPPNDPFELPALGRRNLPHIVIGDYNSLSTTWGYTSRNSEGEAVEQWADSCDFTLIHDTKLPKSFNSARWKKGYKPGLIFVSDSIANMSRKSVMDPIRYTQHRPICVSVQPVVVPQPTPFWRCASTIERRIEMATQQNSKTALKTLNSSHPTTAVL